MNSFVSHLIIACNQQCSGSTLVYHTIVPYLKDVKIDRCQESRPIMCFLPSTIPGSILLLQSTSKSRNNSFSPAEWKSSHLNPVKSQREYRQKVQEKAQ